MVRTPGSHPGNRGSIPLETTKTKRTHTKRGTVHTSVFFLFTPALTEDKQSQVSAIIFLGALSKLIYIKMFF